MPDTVSPAIDIDALRGHIGSKVEDKDIITGWPMAAMTSALDRQEAAPEPGTPIPQGWHQFWFLPTTRPEELGPDGAPKLEPELRAPNPNAELRAPRLGPELRTPTEHAFRAAL